MENLSTTSELLVNIAAPLAIDDPIVTSNSPYVFPKPPLQRAATVAAYHDAFLSPEYPTPSTSTISSVSDNSFEDLNTQTKRMRKYSQSLQHISDSKVANHQQKTTITTKNRAISGRAASTLNLRITKTTQKKRKYDHVKSKVAIYISNIKEQDNKRRSLDGKPRKQETEGSLFEIDHKNEIATKNQHIELLINRYEALEKTISDQKREYEMKLSVSPAKQMAEQIMKTKNTTQVNSLLNSTFCSPISNILKTPSRFSVSQYLKPDRSGGYQKVFHNASVSSIMVVDETIEGGSGCSDNKRTSARMAIKKTFIKLFGKCGGAENDSLEENLQLEKFGDHSFQHEDTTSDEGYGHSNSQLLNQFETFAEDQEKMAKAMKDALQKARCHTPVPGTDPN